MIITSEHGSPTHCVIYGARTKTNIGLRYILTRRAKPIRNVLSSNPIPHPLPPPTACWCRWPKCHSSMLLGSTMESWTTPEYDELCGPGQVAGYWLVRSLRRLISYYERTMTYVFWPAWTEIAWLSLCFILETSWVALYSDVCVSVRHRCHLTKSLLFPIYKGIQALCWPCTT